MTLEERRRRRVASSHRIAVSAFRLAGVFGLIAGGWSVWVLIGGGTWWGPIHAFLLGTVSLAIAGASQMFTITWSAAPAPRAWIPATQRWSHAVGAAAVLLGMAVGSTGAVVLGGVAVLMGMSLLAFGLIGAVRHSLLRRFDLSLRFYLLGIACAVVGVTLGVVMGADLGADHYFRLRVVHGHLNLVGFVGFVIVGTLPTILPTFAHHRAVSGREAVIAWRLALVAAVTITSGLALGDTAVAVGTFLAVGALVAVVVGVVVRLGRTGAGGGLPYLQVVVGCAWLAAWAVIDGVRLLTGSIPPTFDRWIAAAILAGVGQILLGSLAYLLPVLAGPARLGRNFERFDSRRWLPLALANGAAVGIVVGAPAIAIAGFALWLADFSRRLVSLERGTGASASP